MTNFRRDLVDLAAADLAQKHLIVGRSYILTQDEEFRLRKAVGEHFRVHPDLVKVVGSAQLGFSIAATKRYNPFHVKSDIDIAVISPEAFDRIWLETQRFTTASGAWPELKAFRKYLMMGWIRPDFLPVSAAFPITEEWKKAMAEIRQTVRGGAFKINAGLYRTHAFLEDYQLRAIQECKSEAELRQ